MVKQLIACLMIIGMMVGAMVLSVHAQSVITYSYQKTAVTSSATPVSVMPPAVRVRYTCKVPANGGTSPVMACVPYVTNAPLLSSGFTNYIEYAPGDVISDDITPTSGSGQGNPQASLQAVWEGLACWAENGGTSPMECQWR